LAAEGGDSYWLAVGNALGHDDISAGATTATSRSVAGLPSDSVCATVDAPEWRLEDAGAVYLHGLRGGPGADEFSGAGEHAGGRHRDIQLDASASAYWLDVGTAVGQGNVFGANAGRG